MSNRQSDALKQMLRGYAKRGDNALSRLVQVGDWQLVAEREQFRRSTQLIEALDDELLAAIASGEVNVQAVCREVMTEQPQLDQPLQFR